MIHDDNPFVDLPEDRDPVRRFRGRLASPVTIVTAGGPTKRAGLTVSSIMLIDDAPTQVQMVVSPSSDLWQAIEETGRFVVHICDHRNKAMADVFAGLRPSPGGVFASTSVNDDDYGPVLEELTDRLYCHLNSVHELGRSGVVTGSVAGVEISELSEPLVYFRGRYRRLE